MKRCYSVFFSAILLALAATSYAQRITVTIAGNGISATSGDGGPANQASVYSPTMIAANPSGDVFFVDGSTIRMVSSKTGLISTIAGGGTAFVEGAAATSVAITPGYIAADGFNHVYLIDGNKVKVVNMSTGLIRTVAGGSTSGFSGDGGPASAALFGSLNGICVDRSGNIFVSDDVNLRIREINVTTGVINTIAGGGTSSSTMGDGGLATLAALYGPSQITCSPAGNIFFLDGSNIRTITRSTGIISSYAGGGGSIVGCLASDVLIGSLSGLSVDATNDVCWDETSCSCRKIDSATDSVSYIGGDFYTEAFKDDTNSLYAWMDFEYGLVSDAKNNLYIADMGNDRIRKLVYVSSKPTFAFGNHQAINPCPSYTFDLTSQMAITDLETGETETWSVLVAPTLGTLSGFPATASSIGLTKTLRPTGTSYVPGGTTGVDSFVVRVSDGALSDTLTIYVNVQTATPAVVTGSGLVCNGSYVSLAPSVTGGTWTSSNFNATIVSSGAEGLVTGVRTGLDTIYYNRISPCPMVTSFVISINPAPSVASITGADTICVGAASTFSDPTVGGRWSADYGGEVTIDSVTGVVSSSYFGLSALISYTVSDGTCSTSETKSLYINAAVEPVYAGTTSVCLGDSTYLYDEVTGGTWTFSNPRLAVTRYIDASYIYVDGLTTGLDTISYTSTNACGTGTYSYIITVTSSDPGTIAGPASVCTGSTVLFADGIAGGTWGSYIGNISVDALGDATGMSVGPDTLIYMVTGSCGTSFTIYPVVVSTTPDAGSISGPASVCVDSTITVADASTGGVWSLSNTNATVSAGGIITGAMSGSDIATYTVTNACGTATATYTIDVNTDCVTTGIAGAGSVAGIHVFPIPAQNELNINNLSEATTYRIIDVTGKCMIAGTLKAGDNIINLNGMSQAVYQLELVGEDGRKVNYSFVKE